MNKIEHSWGPNDFTEVTLLEPTGNQHFLVTRISMKSVGVGEDWKDAYAVGGTKVGYWVSHGCYLQLIDENGKHIEPWGFSSLTIRGDEMNTPYNAATNPKKDHEIEFAFTNPFPVPTGCKLSARVVLNTRGNANIIPPGDVVTAEVVYHDLPITNEFANGDITKAFTFAGHKHTVKNPPPGETRSELIFDGGNYGHNTTINTILLSYPPLDHVASDSAYWPKLHVSVEDDQGKKRFPIKLGLITPHGGASTFTTPAYYYVINTPFVVSFSEKVFLEIPAFKMAGAPANYSIEDYIRVLLYASPI